MVFRNGIVYIIILFGILINSYSQSPQISSKNKLQSSVDSIITNGIINEAFPGAQLLVAKEGTIVFHKAYGYHTYDSLQPVKTNDLYDLASLTKILGPLPLLMKLYEEGKIDLDAPFSTYWKSWQRIKNKKDLTLREILAHQAGLTPYIVFLNEVMRKDELKSRFLSNKLKGNFKKQAYEDLYVANRFQHKMNRMIRRSEVDDLKEYKYSGLAFLLFPELIEKLTGHSYSYELTKEFIFPLDIPSLGFLPQKKGFPNALVPTEYDHRYRKALVHGWVHDENASLLGGISGNAGLFGTAHDLYRFMQFYQNYGVLEGHRLLKEETVREFTSIQYPENENRRGLGFDKPLLDNVDRSLEDAYPAPSASPESFGHSGFTGTFVWADPKYQLVFIFLSNRVHPFRTHRNLYDLHIRTSLHEVFYTFYR
ncbi:serine hydrolase [uncultured Muriicola sp.]|uniref:serine hydrolase domain-containing protein n=1 Tax=uncultured Muriicola sp. TaxID=1583102 RepID=UPI00262EC855|nr:serine hydrolase [uncultured Muriicola sp.]